MLRRAVRTAADGTVEQVAEAAEHAVPGEIDDDMAVVVVRTSEVDLASWEGQFPAEPIRVSEARRLAHETFMNWGMDIEQADLTCLLVSEVVTNVVLHAAVSPTPAARARAGRRRTRPARDPRRLGDPAVRRGLRRRRRARTSRSGCAAVTRRSGSRCSTPTCGCPGSGAPARATRAGAACTWWISWRRGGARVRPRTARPSGSRCRSRAVTVRPACARRLANRRCASVRLAGPQREDADHDGDHDR